MIQCIAYLALTILLGLNGLASNWFVFGLWPHSWGAYCLFTGLGLLIVAAMQAVQSVSTKR